MLFWHRAKEAILSYKTQEEVGTHLRSLRVRAGLSQEELAAEVGVGQTAISRIESGERAVSARMLILLADRFGVPASAILKSEEDALALLRAGDSEPEAVKASIDEFRSCIEDYFGIDSLVA